MRSPCLGVLVLLGLNLIACVADEPQAEDSTGDTSTIGTTDTSTDTSTDGSTGDTDEGEDTSNPDTGDGDGDGDACNGECIEGTSCVNSQCAVDEPLPDCEAPSLAETFAFEVAGDASDLAIADLDQDGVAELVAVDDLGMISWSWDTQLATRSELELLPSSSRQLALLHLDDDGLLDAAVSQPSTHRLVEIYGDGAGGFMIGQSWLFGANAIGDVRRIRAGGQPDWMTARHSVGGDVLHQFPIWTQLPDSATQVLDGPGYHFVYDVDGDGLDELLIADVYGRALEIWTIEGEGLVLATTLDTGMDPWLWPCRNLAVADLDLDAVPDLTCIADHTLDQVQMRVWRGLGELEFEPAGLFAGWKDGREIGVGDIYGDGRRAMFMDFGTMHGLDDEGGFTCSLDLFEEIGARLRVGDLDGDGDDELAVWFRDEAEVRAYDLME